MAMIKDVKSDYKIVNQTKDSFAYFKDKVVEYKDEMSATIGVIIVILQTAWATISPIIESSVQGIGNVLKTTTDFIFSVIQTLGNFFSYIGNMFNAIKSLLQGNADDSKEYFRKALESLVNFFVGIGNSIIAVMNNLWSLIFNSFKGFVNGFGGIIGKIGDWLGFDWELKWSAAVPLIPQIPKAEIPALAQGAVIPPNREFLAVLGDQKQGTNIETPLATMIEAFQMALDSRGGYNGGNTEVVLEIDGREFGRAVVEQGERESRRLGARLVVV